MGNHCEEHSGVCELVKQHDHLIKSIPKQFWAIIIILLGITTAVLGVLWTGQANIVHKMETNQEKIIDLVRENSQGDINYRVKADRKMDRIMIKLGLDRDWRDKEHDK